MKNKRKSSPKKRFPFRLLLVLLILIAAGFLVMRIQAGLKLNFTNPFVKTESTYSSDLILRYVRDISRLNTIEFIYKSVFPYDLLDRSIDLEELVGRYNRHEGEFSTAEVKMLSVYGISKQAGIDLLKDPYSFAVIQARIKAGYDFNPADNDDMVRADPENETVYIKLPMIKITEIIIEDSDSSTYDYPDLRVSPEQWRTLTSLMSEMVSNEAVKRGILDEADRRGRDFISKMMKSAGFGNVVFSN